MPFDNERKIVVCDGCRVKFPFEHRCHGENAFVLGFATGKPCECPTCVNKAAKKEEFWDH